MTERHERRAAAELESAYQPRDEGAEVSVRGGPMAVIGRMLLRVLLPLLIGLGAIGALASWQSSPPEVTQGPDMLLPGSLLATMDSEQSGANYRLNFPAGMQETDLIIWDYAAEDGDMVQIKANGLLLGEPFPITHAPKTVRVPVGADVVVVGTKDGGGGGVTYAVNFPAIRMSIRNGTRSGEGNHYDLQQQK